MKNAIYNFQRKYSRWGAVCPDTFMPVLMIGVKYGLPESLAATYRKWFLDTLSVPACFLQPRQRGILEIVEKMFECSLEVR